MKIKIKIDTEKYEVEEMVKKGSKEYEAEKFNQKIKKEIITELSSKKIENEEIKEEEENEEIISGLMMTKQFLTIKKEETIYKVEIDIKSNDGIIIVSGHIYNTGMFDADFKRFLILTLTKNINFYLMKNYQNYFYDINFI